MDMYQIPLSDMPIQVVNFTFKNIAVRLTLRFNPAFGGGWNYDLETDKVRYYGDALASGVRLTERKDLPFDLAVVDLAESGESPSTLDAFNGQFMLVVRGRE